MGIGCRTYSQFSGTTANLIWYCASIHKTLKTVKIWLKVKCKPYFHAIKHIFSFKFL